MSGDPSVAPASQELDLTIFVACYNEEANIIATLDTIAESFRGGVEQTADYLTAAQHVVTSGAKIEGTAAERKLDPLLPAMKAHGVPALIRHVNGEITLEEAAGIGCADTRHYAKRQFTWFRHQLPEFEWGEPETVGEWLKAKGL